MKWTPSPQYRRAWRAAARWYNRLLPVLLGVAALSAVPALAAELLVPDQTVVGQLQYDIVKKGEVFGDIARRFDVGYTELVEANPGVDPGLPGTLVHDPLALHPAGRAAARHRSQSRQYRLF